MCLAETLSFGYSLGIFIVLKSRAKENILNFKWVLKV